jgi:sugar/nucleoside kinase (ribokinase family)
MPHKVSSKDRKNEKVRILIVSDTDKDHGPLYALMLNYRFRMRGFEKSISAESVGVESGQRNNTFRTEFLDACDCMMFHRDELRRHEARELDRMTTDELRGFDLIMCMSAAQMEPVLKKLGGPDASVSLVDESSIVLPESNGVKAIKEHVCRLFVLSYKQSSKLIAHFLKVKDPALQ